MGLMGWDGINSAVTENAWDGKKSRLWWLFCLQSRVLFDAVG